MVLVDREYQDFVRQSVATLKLLAYLKLAMMSAVLVATTALAFFFWRLGNAVRLWLHNATQQTGLVQNLLTTVKGWTVIQVVDRAEAIRTVAELADKNAEKVADKVAQRITQTQSDSVPDSGSLPVVKSPANDPSNQGRTP